MNGDHPARFSSRSVGAIIAIISACFSRISLRPSSKRPDEYISARAHQFVLDFDRRQESAEQADHMIGKTRAAAEGVGNLRDRDAQVLLSGLAIRHVLRHLAQPVEIVDENDQARRPRRLDADETPCARTTAAEFPPSCRDAASPTARSRSGKLPAATAHRLRRALPAAELPRAATVPRPCSLPV